MTTSAIHGFDGLMALSRREGVDIRPTLLRVLTDLYVQANAHTADEERQFAELASRLIDQVDDATRVAVRARLSIYPRTPPDILALLALKPASSGLQMHVATGVEPTRSRNSLTRAPADAKGRTVSTLAIQPEDAAVIHQMFFAAHTRERAQILFDLAQSPIKQSTRIPERRAARAVEALEMAAFVGDIENFVLEMAETLILPTRVASQIVNDAGGEALACAAKALQMPPYVFQRVLLFLNPSIGSSVTSVYRLSRLYDVMSERSALIMLAAWRGATMTASRAKYRPSLYDDERHRARPASGQAKVDRQQPGATIVSRGNSAG